jgi:hypothetical protein
MNEMPKFVASNTLADPTSTNTTVLRGKLGQEVQALKERYPGDILVGESSQLVQAPERRLGARLVTGPADRLPT